jgi:hypothetical protein
VTALFLSVLASSVVLEVDDTDGALIISKGYPC